MGFERGWMERLEEADGGVITHTTLGAILARTALVRPDPALEGLVASLGREPMRGLHAG
jgi:hypothetical protein